VAANDPVLALTDFKPNFYDLLLVDIDMPRINGFAALEEILFFSATVELQLL